MADTDELQDQIDQNSVIEALKGAPQRLGTPTIAQALEHQKRWGMAPAGQQAQDIASGALGGTPLFVISLRKCVEQSLEKALERRRNHR